MKYFSKKSPCYDKLHRHISKQFEKLENEHLVQWSFFKVRGINDVFSTGQKIHYSGVGYDGSPHQTFWSQKYIPSYIEDILDSSIEEWRKCFKEFGIFPNKSLQELEELFLPKVAEIYQKMAKIDSTLRGSGIDNPVPIDVTENIKNCQQKLTGRIDMHRHGFLKNLVWCSEFLKLRIPKA